MKRKHWKPKQECRCSECGNVFSVFHSQIRRGRGVFCSKQCLGVSKRHGSTLFCSWCDASFYRRFGEQDAGKVRSFCSRACYGEWRAFKRTSYPKAGPRHQHRIVAEAVLGRLLTANEVVHHIDNNRQNCRPENLCVFPSQSLHARCHFGRMTRDEIARYELLRLAGAAV